MMTVIAALLLASTQSASGMLGDVRMHLFYQHTGRLSADVSKIPDFAGWNVGIGEGGAEEPANDLLVVAEIRTSGEQFVDSPLRVVVTAGGKELATRQFGSVLTSEEGRAYLPVWLRDVGCAGKIQVRVTFRKQTRSKVLELNCGE
jgi:hypothetical protein